MKHNSLCLWHLILLLATAGAWFAAPAVAQPTDTSAVASKSESDADPESEAEAEPEDAEERVAVNLRGADLKQISRFLMDQLGKPVVIGEGVDGVELSVMAPKKMPLNEALELMGNALRAKGVVIVRSDRVTQLLPIAAVRQMPRPLVGPEATVGDLADTSAIVDKVFALQHASAQTLKDAVLPALPSYAFLTANANLNTLTVTAAVADLVQVERLVARLDVPGAGAAVERIFHLKHGDPAEVANLVRTLLGGSLGIEPGDIYVSPLGGGDGGKKSRGRNNRGRGNGNGNNDDAGPGTLLIKGSDAPIMLTPDVSRRWIIASAPPRVMAQIETWVAEFDRPGVADPAAGTDGTPAAAAPAPYELVQVHYTDVEELSDQLTQAIASMPDPAVRDGVRVVPFAKSGRLLVYGSTRGRELVGTLLAELDVEVKLDQVIEEITLKNASAEAVQGKIEDLFEDGQQPRNVRFFYGRTSDAKKPLTVTADPQRNSVTVKTDPARLKQIKELIATQWDTPLDYDEVKPRVYTLKHSDPIQVQTLLEDMFSRSSSSSSFNFFSGQRTTTNDTPVGPLFGQFSFEALANSDKLIVSTKNVGNYAVIDALLEDLDQPQDAGTPIIIELKHANAEDVAEQLNAMFSEAGTPAAITRAERGLSAGLRADTGVGERGGGNQNNNNRNNNQNNNQDDGDASQMNFWWSQSRANPNEQPVSNLIGKPRIVPVNRRNAVMLISPRAHIEPLRSLILDLDKAGAQVSIHAIIAEVQHNDESTIGVRIASDPSVFSESRLADQSIGGGIDGNLAEAIFRGDGVINANFDLNFLIQFLVSDFGLTILNEPRVYTADNQEAHFFDGQDVPVIANSLAQAASDSGNVTQTFEYESVGTRLHVRPHITQNGEIDLRVNLEISRVVSGASVFGNPLFDRQTTTTNVTLKDGQTIVISGMVEREEFTEIRKLPLFGDLPLIGGLFRNTDEVSRNREVIAFVTPRILRSGTPEAEEESRRNQEWLNRLRGAGASPLSPDGSGEPNDDAGR